MRSQSLTQLKWPSMYACMLARKGEHPIIASEGKNVNIVTSRALPGSPSGWALGSAATSHLELGLGWGVVLLCRLERVTSRNSLSISLVLPLPLFFLLFSYPDTISWGNPFIYAFFYTANRRRQWHPTPVLLPGKSHGWRSLVSCSPWGR